jgi:RNA polymerase sigma-70 factor, ECF subfamily
MTTMVSEIPIVSTQTPDGVLVAKTLAGQKSAFNELVQRYQARATAVAYRLLGNLQDALEIAQEAFLKAFTNLRTLQKADAFGAWLIRIVSNLSLNFRRSRKSFSALPLDDLLPAAAATITDSSLAAAAHNADPCRKIESAELGARIELALADLPDRQRDAIAMFALDQIPQKRVAQTLGCSIEAVKWHVFDARRKLRESLQNCLSA